MSSQVAQDTAHETHASSVTHVDDLAPIETKGSGPDIEEEKRDAAAPAEEGGLNQSGVLTGFRLFAVFLSLMLACFMFALDQSIVATAIPVIVSDFSALTQVSWIISAYFLTQCGLILLAGQLLTVIKAKWLLLGAIFFFEAGSLICALANSMSMLIVARAIQGIGASGMFVSMLAIIAVVTRVDQRAAFMSTFGLVFVLSSVVGPLLGGVFTERLTWRWCFYINLPFGGVAATAVVFLLPAREPDRSRKDGITGWRAIAKMDWIGSALIIAVITCLLIALQWGGNDYAWSNWRIILLFTLGGVGVIAFAAWELYYDEHALIPKVILKDRNQIAACATIFMFMLAMLGGTYQLPIFYEATRNHSPEKAGIDIIPYMLAVCIGIFVAGGLTAKWGKYWPQILAGPPIAAVGFGLMYTIREDTSNAKIIGYQILSGFGIGIAFQNIILSVQAEYATRPELLPQASGVASFFQLTGAAIGIGIVDTVESIYLNRYLHEYAPDAPFETVRESTSAIYTLPVDQQAPVIHAYVLAISRSFIPIFIALSISMVSAVFIRNHDMRKIGGTAHAAMA
ncbi:hypothetical protein Q5752_004747 [Cryptotrichosporon argae]